jgi:hypothetical protein
MSPLNSTPSLRPIRGPTLWLGAAGLAVMVGIAALAWVDNGAVLQRWLSPLSAVEQPLGELAAASQGGDAISGIEYVAFLQDGRGPEALDTFFAGHPQVKFVSPGFFPGVVVVRIGGDITHGVASLKNEPVVRVLLKSRLGMVCH